MCFGQVFIVDAPTLSTGSGQYFYYWKAIEVVHEFSAQRGWFTKYRAVPWFSGTITAPNSNLIEYSLPYRYDPLPAPRPQPRPWWMPTNKAWIGK